ncbi:MAG TPA: hypothetical protein VKY19_00155 [Ktedonosporobacter sp.]|jgi:hypothetical protein|nr:hypothetical protein [Ktedonosporobacter sp.]
MQSNNFAREKEVETHMKEYETLRAEIGFRLDAQSQLANIALLLLGGITTISVALFSLNAGTLKLTIPPIYLIFTLLIFALLFTSLALAFLRQQVELGRLATYCHQFIRPRVGELLGLGTADSILQWDHWHAKQAVPSNTFHRFVASVFMFSQLAVMVIPALVTLLVSASIYISSFPILPDYLDKWIALGLLFFDLGYLALLVPCGQSALRAFTEIGSSLEFSLLRSKRK